MGLCIFMPAGIVTAIPNAVAVSGPGNNWGAGRLIMVGGESYSVSNS